MRSSCFCSSSWDLSNSARSCWRSYGFCSRSASRSFSSASRISRFVTSSSSSRIRSIFWTASSVANSLCSRSCRLDSIFSRVSFRLSASSSCACRERSTSWLLCHEDSPCLRISRETSSTFVSIRFASSTTSDSSSREVPCSSSISAKTSPSVGKRNT